MQCLKLGKALKIGIPSNFQDSSKLQTSLVASLWVGRKAMNTKEGKLCIENYKRLRLNLTYYTVRDFTCLMECPDILISFLLS